MKKSILILAISFFTLCSFNVPSTSNADAPTTELETWYYRCKGTTVWKKMLMPANSTQDQALDVAVAICGG